MSRSPFIVVPEELLEAVAIARTADGRRQKNLQNAQDLLEAYVISLSAPQPLDPIVAEKVYYTDWDEICADFTYEGQSAISAVLRHLLSEQGAVFSTHQLLEVNRNFNIDQGNWTTVLQARFHGQEEWPFLLRGTPDTTMMLEATAAFYSLNSLRRYIPNFMFVYALMLCTSPVVDEESKKLLNWCEPVSKRSKPGSYLLCEFIPHAQLMEKALDKLGFADFFSVLVQILNAFNMAYTLCGYNHRDFHLENVLVSGVDEALAIPMESTKYSVHLRTSMVATIIDYGKCSFALTTDHGTVPIGYVHDTIVKNKYSEAKAGFDFYNCLQRCENKLRKNGKAKPEHYALVSQLLTLYHTSNPNSYLRTYAPGDRPVLHHGYFTKYQKQKNDFAHLLIDFLIEEYPAYFFPGRETPSSYPPSRKIEGIPSQLTSRYVAARELLGDHNASTKLDQLFVYNREYFLRDQRRIREKVATYIAEEQVMFYPLVPPLERLYALYEAYRYLQKRKDSLLNIYSLVLLCLVVTRYQDVNEAIRQELESYNQWTAKQLPILNKLVKDYEEPRLSYLHDVTETKANKVHIRFLETAAIAKLYLLPRLQN